jgi:hypothetical protein
MKRRFSRCAIAMALCSPIAQSAAPDTRPEQFTLDGAPISRQPVSIQCAYGNATATTDANGFWAIDASSLAFPCLVQTRTPGGEAVHSIAGRPGAIYVTPLTDAALSEAMPEDLQSDADHDMATAIPAVWHRLHRSIWSIRQKMADSQIPVNTADLFHSGQDPTTFSRDNEKPPTQEEVKPVLHGLALHTVQMKMQPRGSDLIAGLRLGTDRLDAPYKNASPCVIGGVWLQAASIKWHDALPAHGQQLLVKQYPELFRLLGTSYGGDGMTSFGLPDLRAQAPAGFSHIICVNESKL